MLNIRQRIQNCLSDDLDNTFIINLFELMCNSFEDISISNKSFVEFISLFDNVNDPNDMILWDKNFSVSLFHLLYLDFEQLKVLYNFLNIIESHLSEDEKFLIEDNLIRGRNDTSWLIEISCVQLKITESFRPFTHLKDHEIIDSYYQGMDKQQELYFINLLKDKPWETFSQETLVAFLQGADFYFLSNKAFFFMLPACLKLCIDMLKEGKYKIIPLEEISWFLKDGDRRVIIDSKTKEIVNDFLKLLSHPSYYFFSLNDYTLNELCEIWNSKN